MRKFVAVDIDSSIVKLEGHQMVNETYYVQDHGKIAILDSLHELPEELEIFWFEE